jgi:hypothetical protein
MVTELQKRCWRCPPDKALQPLSNFCRNGKDSACKTCRYELNAEWSKDNRESLRSKRAAYMKEYRRKKKEGAVHPDVSED